MSVEKSVCESVDGRLSAGMPFGTSVGATVNMRTVIFMNLTENLYLHVAWIIWSTMGAYSWAYR